MYKKKGHCTDLQLSEDILHTNPYYCIWCPMQSRYAMPVSQVHRLAVPWFFFPPTSRNLQGQLLGEGKPAQLGDYQGRWSRRRAGLSGGGWRENKARTGFSSLQIYFSGGRRPRLHGCRLCPAAECPSSRAQARAHPSAAQGPHRRQRPPRRLEPGTRRRTTQTFREQERTTAGSRGARLPLHPAGEGHT